LENLIDRFSEGSVLFTAALLIGFMFGAAAQHSQFCLRAATIELSESTLGPRMAIWFLAFFAAVLSVQILIAIGYLDVSGSRQIAATGSLSGAVIGGLMFGIGMILARVRKPPFGSVRHGKLARHRDRVGSDSRSAGVVARISFALSRIPGITLANFWRRPARSCQPIWFFFKYARERSVLGTHLFSMASRSSIHKTKPYRSRCNRWRGCWSWLLGDLPCGIALFRSRGCVIHHIHRPLDRYVDGTDQ
jgi:hypothetical protein